MMNAAGSVPSVYVIVITYNGRHHLELCLPSLLKTTYSNYRIVLLDNASTDGASDYVENAFPCVTIIRNQNNYGFAKGNNIAMAQALAEGADYVLLLNDDTIILDPDWLTQAVAVAEREEMTGMVGFDVTADRSIPIPDTYEVEDVERIQGSSLLIKSGVLSTLGYFDEVYFAYGEESDLEARALKAGFRLRKINAPLYHKGSGSFSKTPIRFAFLFIRNWIRFSIKNEAPAKALLRPLIIFDLLCSPFPLRNRSIDVAARARFGTGSRATNFALLVGAVLWNLLHLPQTLTIKHQDLRRVKIMQSLRHQQTAG